jgi:hypothetical protein
MRMQWLLRCGLVISVVGVGGCGAGSYLDPYQKPYIWHPTGAPIANIAAQLVDPRDLVTGRGTTEGDVTEATLAIDHVRQDKPKSISAAASSGGASASAAAGGAN